MNTQYTKAEKKKVITLRSKGLTYKKISKSTKVPVPTVGYWIRATSKTTPSLRKKLAPRPRRTK